MATLIASAIAIAIWRCFVLNMAHSTPLHYYVVKAVCGWSVVKVDRQAEGCNVRGAR